MRPIERIALLEKFTLQLYERIKELQEVNDARNQGTGCCTGKSVTKASCVNRKD